MGPPSFGRGGSRGGKSSRGGKGKGGKGKGKGGYDSGPPDRVVEIGVFLHGAEEDLVCKSTNEKIPYFNAPIYLENKQKVGKVEDVLGPINEVFFTIKPEHGVEATGFEKEKKFFIDPMKLLDASRFIETAKTGTSIVKLGKSGKKGGKGGGKGGKGKGGKGKGGKGKGKGSRGGGKGGSRGGRGGSRGGRGGF